MYRGTPERIRGRPDLQSTRAQYNNIHCSTAIVTPSLGKDHEQLTVTQKDAEFILKFRAAAAEELITSEMLRRFPPNSPDARLAMF